jgi:hypothetical protein
MDELVRAVLALRGARVWRPFRNPKDPARGNAATYDALAPKSRPARRPSRHA